jgi:hypothetical protein
MAGIFSRVDHTSVISLLVLAAGVLLLWDTPLVYPLKVLVVFFHELSHGAMAVLTGGEIIEIEVVAQQGGHCITAGGSRFLTLSAGYLGSLLWGAAILILAARTRFDRPLSVLLGVLLLVITLIYVRPFISFGFFFGAASAAALIASGIWLSERVNDFFLRIIGLTSCLYAIADIKSDVLDRPGLRSDAAMLGELTGIPTQVWGVLWIALAVLGAGLALLVASRDTSTGLARLRKTAPAR